MLVCVATRGRPRRGRAATSTAASTSFSATTLGIGTLTASSATSMRAHTDDYGQWSKAGNVPPQPPVLPVVVKLSSDELLRLI